MHLIIMWSMIVDYMRGHSERLAVVKVLLENGFCIKDDRIYCNEVEIATVSVARIAKVNRRTVSETISMINKDEKLKEIFSYIRSAGLSLKEAAKYLDLGVIEITPTDPRTVGILAKAASLIVEQGLSIRQALVDDPELFPEPKLTLIVGGEIPGELVTKFLKINGVDKVSIY